MSYSNGLLNSEGQRGLPGVGFKLTDDGNFDIDQKRLTNVKEPTEDGDATAKKYVDQNKSNKNDVVLRDGSQNMTGNLDLNDNRITGVADSIDDDDAVNKKQLKSYTQFSQNNYHLQPSFRFYKDFGDKSQLTIGTPPNTPSNHFFQSHKAYNDAYIIEKEGDDTGFSGEAWSNMKIKGNNLSSGSYTAIFEIFVIGPSGSFRVDDTISYQVWGDSHYTITTFDSDKINGQYTISIIQFTTDGGAGADDGIKFQIKYFGSQYNKNIKFLFYSRVIKGSQSTSFDHTIFNVSDVQDNHTILYFENLNLNGNLIDGLGDPVKLANAANKNYVDNENSRQDIAIADKASKSYVDGEIAKIPHVAAATDVLKLDGSKAMTGDLDMANHNLINLKDPQPSNASHAASVNFVNTTINDNNTIIDGIIDRKIKESEASSIESNDRENVFKKVMDDVEFKEDHDKIHKVGVENKNFHLVNKKTYEFKIDYDSSLGYYSTRLAIDLIYLPVGSYTMVYEMYVEDGITIDEIDATSGTLTVGKINSRIDGTKTRSIIHFTKYTISSGFDDLEIDLKLKSKTDPQTTIYVIVYGVKGCVNNVSVGIWDRFYYYDGSSAKYEVPIDMNSKDITNVNKITTKDLDVNGQIDMKSKKITGVGDGTANSDAVNKAQLESVISLFNIINNTVAKNSANIAKINVSNSYHFFTDQLKHDNSNTVKFPAISNNYPYSADDESELLRIHLDGHYHIIYTDFCKYKGAFTIHDDTNGNDLFVTQIDYTDGWKPLIINAVIPITTDNGFNHAEIKLYIQTTDNAILDGTGYSTFFIKYLGP